MKKIIKNYINKQKHSTKGITLIALVVTIVVLLILASITIGTLTGDNSIIKLSKEGKETSEVAEEKNILELSAIQAASNNEYGNVVEDELKKKLDRNIGEGKYKLEIENNQFKITFNESNRSYFISKDANIEFDAIPKVTDKTPGDLTDGNTLDGTKENPYKLGSVEDYVAFIKNTRSDSGAEDMYYDGKYIEISTDLDFFNTNSYVNPDTTQFGDYNRDGVTEGLFYEITNENARGVDNGQKFYGTLNGNGHTLYNFFMADKLGDNVHNPSPDTRIGMVQQNYGTIENLNIKGQMKAILSDKLSLIRVGGITGTNETTGKIVNCQSNLQLICTGLEINITRATTDITIGGIVGKNEGIIDRCIFNGSLQGDFKITADTSSSYYSDILIGGIVGENTNTIINCINKGNLSNKYSFSSTVGAPNNEMSLGGITGKNQETGTIENCINLGNIENISNTTEIKVAGITAESEDIQTCIIKNVYNGGTIKGESIDILEISGILAEGYGNLNYAYNRGAIIDGGTPTSLRKGAIIGRRKLNATATTIQNCYYNKIDGIYGAEGQDIENITSVTNLTQTQIIEYMNTNVKENNTAGNANIWYEFKIENGEISF